MRILKQDFNLEEYLGKVRVADQKTLMLDYDGTLAPFKKERDLAFPYPEICDILPLLISQINTRVVIITGRKVTDIPYLLRIREIPEIWGSHGLERLLPNGRYEAIPIPSNITNVINVEYDNLLSNKWNPFIEKKIGSIAVHWRGLAESKAKIMHDYTLNRWLPLSKDTSFKIYNFDNGIELRYSAGNKGNAVNTILTETGPDSPIAMLGDDLTDEDAFQALGDRGLSVLVENNLRPTLAQIWLVPPQDVIDFLKEWINKEV